jgi:hypothetical protein
MRMLSCDGMCEGKDVMSIDYFHNKTKNGEGTFVKATAYCCVPL